MTLTSIHVWASFPSAGHCHVTQFFTLAQDDKTGRCHCHWVVSFLGFSLIQLVISRSLFFVVPFKFYLFHSRSLVVSYITTAWTLLPPRPRELTIRTPRLVSTRSSGVVLELAEGSRVDEGSTTCEEEKRRIHPTVPVVHSGGQQRPLYTLALWNLPSQSELCVEIVAPVQKLNGS